MMSGWLNIPVYGALLGLLYHQALVYLFGMWRKEDFNYGYVILPIVLYLALGETGRAEAAPFRSVLAGADPGRGWGSFFYALGELGGEYTTLFLSLWLMVFGLCWLHLGWGKLKVVAFPVAFLLVMFPPPNLIYGNISLRLQLISSQVGVWMIRVFGMTAYREGNVIDLGFTQLQVVDACSGLRYLFPLLALGILIAYHFRASFWKRAVLVLSAVPVTVFTNSLRIATVGFLYPVWGAKVAEGFFHDFSGWLIFMASLAILLAEMWLLGRIFPEPDRSAVVNEGPALSDGIPIEEKSGVPRGRGWGPPQSVVAVVLLLATLLVFRSVEFREKVPVSRPLAQVPLSMGEWIGRPEGDGTDLPGHPETHRLFDRRLPGSQGERDQRLRRLQRPAGQGGVEPFPRFVPAGQRLGVPRFRDGRPAGDRRWRAADAGETGPDGEERRPAARVLLVPPAGADPHEHVPVEGVRLLGRADAPAHRRRPGPADHAGV